MKTGKLLVASGALAAMLTMTLSGAVLANGVGDLYVASAAGVLEIHVKTSTVVSTIPMVPAPLSLAFTPDGTTLYACGGGSAIIPIDIATLDVQSSVIMPGPVSVLAFPAGQILVGSGTGSQLGAYAYAAGQVILVIGHQKLVRDIDEGLRRIREYSLPREFGRMQAAGYPGSLLARTLILHADPRHRIMVVLVPETLGF